MYHLGIQISTSEIHDFRRRGLRSARPISKSQKEEWAVSGTDVTWKGGSTLPRVEARQPIRCRLRQHIGSRLQLLAKIRARPMTISRPKSLAQTKSLP
ncbi:hypothetical protein NL676_031192 [Syzygium grande]|nr:hypothetical protein NL676_031192 [Syzygium grande]